MSKLRHLNSDNTIKSCAYTKCIVEWPIKTLWKDLTRCSQSAKQCARLINKQPRGTEWRSLSHEWVNYWIRKGAFPSAWESPIKRPCIPSQGCRLNSFQLGVVFIIPTVWLLDKITGRAASGEEKYMKSILFPRELKYQYQQNGHICVSSSLVNSLLIYSPNEVWMTLAEGNTRPWFRMIDAFYLAPASVRPRRLMQRMKELL